MVELDDCALALADGVESALPGWVERCVDGIHRAWSGPPPAPVREAARQAGAGAAIDIGPRVRALLQRDVDDQPTTPLAIVRAAVTYPTGVLRGAGVPPVERDPLDEAMFPDDDYGLTPASFADLDPGLAELALQWGAAKVWVHRRRHEVRHDA